ncbi:MAG: DNA mismatch repair protein MutS [Candidatus Cloacimonadaceae bacterium]
MKKVEIADAKLTPMLKQYLEVKKAHPDKLVLFRMGDFYETFFDDAYTSSKLLNITLTTRDRNSENPVPLAGFPYHALDNYLDKLIKAGLKVVICEQVEDPKTAVGLVKRDVTEIITPGAILDQNLIDLHDNNFLGSIYLEKNTDLTGFAVLDISTADFRFTEVPSEELVNEVQRLHPAEIIVNSTATEQWLKEKLKDFSVTVTVFDNWQFQPSEAIALLKRHFQVQSLEAFGAHDKLLGATAAGAALAYVQSLYKDKLAHISGLHYYSLSNFMQLDEVTRRNLELLKSMRYGNRSGSLIDVIDRTQTPMGARLVHQWLLNPLLDIEEITRRQDVITLLLSNFPYLKDLRASLKDVGDLSRLISKIGSLRINPREVLALQSYLMTLKELSGILSHFESPVTAAWQEQFCQFDELISRIGNAIEEKPPLTITEGGIFKRGYHSELDELLSLSHDGKTWIAALEEDERKKTGIPSLKVGYNKVFGYYIEVTSTHKNKVPDYYLPKQTLVNAERYISPRLKEYEAKVLSAEERRKSLEYELYKDFRTYLAGQIPALQALSETVALLDVYAGLAFLAHQNNYCKPEFTTERTLEIRNGRHPVIEQLLTGEEFIPNDTFLNCEDNRIAIITGPNMAGKSTYLRQIGLLIILAQMGSYVPASALKSPIFDRIFTRVGASDNLAQGQSTFLVEMIETANILHSATPNSLILLDEIGRGTSTFDGLSLAWSIVEYIEKNIAALTLFATHYHELTELENLYPSVKNYNIAVKEWQEQMIFLRKIERGGADQSYGIQVAGLAGLPDAVIRRAKDILHNLEEHEISPQGLTNTIRRKLNQSVPQMEIFEVLLDKTEEKTGFLQEIKDLDLDSMTPIQAWQFLKDLQNRI